MEQLIEDNNNDMNAINFTNSVLLDNLISTLKIHCPHSKQAKKEYLTNNNAKDNKNKIENKQQEEEQEEEENSYCKWTGTLNEYQNHLEKCDFIGVTCPLQMIGCKADNMIQMDIPTHFNNYNIQHLIIMAQKLNQCQTTLQQQNQRVNNKKKQKFCVLCVYFHVTQV